MENFLARSQRESSKQHTLDVAYQPGNGSRFAYPETPDEEEKEEPSGPSAVYKVIS